MRNFCLIPSNAAVNSDTNSATPCRRINIYTENIKQLFNTYAHKAIPLFLKLASTFANVSGPTINIIGPINKVSNTAIDTMLSLKIDNAPGNLIFAISSSLLPIFPANLSVIKIPNICW